MRKYVTVFLFITIVLTLCSCGFSTNKDLCGEWIADNISFSNSSLVTEAELAAYETTYKETILILNDDKTGTLKYIGKNYNITWQLETQTELYIFIDGVLFEEISVNKEGLCFDVKTDKVDIFIDLIKNNSIETNETTITTESGISEGSIIDTEYYTITVPKSWDEDCFYEMPEGEHYNYSLSFYDKESHEAINGGWLFTIDLLTEFDDYSNFPNYDVLGSLEVYRIGSYNIVVTYPTGVQFSEDTAKKYSELSAEIPNILESISFKEECTFSATPLEIQKQSEITESSTGSYVSRANGIWHHTINRLDTQTLQIFEDNTFSLHYISVGEVKETVDGIYTIISDDGKYQGFVFTEYGNTGVTWTAKIWQTELKDTNNVSYTGLVYINSENETIYYTGRKW